MGTSLTTLLAPNHSIQCHLRSHSGCGPVSLRPASWNAQVPTPSPVPALRCVSSRSAPSARPPLGRALSPAASCPSFGSQLKRHLLGVPPTPLVTLPRASQALFLLALTAI